MDGEARVMLDPDLLTTAESSKPIERRGLSAAPDG
jgi:hypothetical protein